MELVESQPLLEWLANNYKSFGATLEIITDKSQEGSQFVRGFGGIGGDYIIGLTMTDASSITNHTHPILRMLKSYSLVDHPKTD